MGGGRGVEMVAEERVRGQVESVAERAGVVRMT